MRAKIPSILMFVLAAVFVGMGCYGGLQVYRFEHDCIRAPGRIVAHGTRRVRYKFEREVDHDVDVYEFVTQHGYRARYEFQPYGGGHDPIGTTATICYPPAAPAQARLAGEMTAPLAMMFGMGALFALGGGLSLKRAAPALPINPFAARNRAKRERKRRQGA